MLASAALVSCGNNKLSDTSGEQIPVIGYEGIPTKLWTAEGYSLQESYKDMAEAGFTVNLSLDIGFHRGNPTPDLYFTTLDVAHDNGMKLIVGSEALLTFSPEDVKKLIAHPALFAYRVWDEPGVERYDTIAQIVKRLQAIDNTHPAYVNMFGNWWPEFPDHLRLFIEKVPVPLLSYDVYPVVLNEDGTRTVRDGLYNSLELFSGEAKRTNKTFWAFALSFTHWSYPVPTLADLRVQVYSNLAYGAQGITYYSYWSLPLVALGDWVKEEFYGPISRDGKKTDIYYTVQAMNKEIKALSPVFLNANMIWVGFTGKFPEVCKPLSAIQLPEAIKSVEIADNHDALVSFMEKGDDRFLVIVNRDLNSESMQARAIGTEKLNIVTKDGTVVRDDGEMKTVTAGDALIYFWKNKTKK